MIGTDWFLLGAPWDCSGSGRGEALAPDALRAAGLSTLIDLDLGNAATRIDSIQRDESTGVLALPETVAAARALAGSLTRAMHAYPGRRPLVVGGDCSILLGVFAALRADLGDVGMWFLDGHPDYLNGATSDSGETADMDLAILTGDGAADLVSLAPVTPMLSVEHVALLGHRSAGLDRDSAAEVDRLPTSLFRIDAATVVRDPQAAGERAAAWAHGIGTPMWLHVDVDVLDPAALPAVTYPQAGGPGWDQLEAVLAPLGQSPRLLGVSVADYRPDLDPTGEQARQLVEVIDRTCP